MIIVRVYIVVYRHTGISLQPYSHQLSKKYDSESHSNEKCSHINDLISRINDNSLVSERERERESVCVRECV